MNMKLPGAGRGRSKRKRQPSKSGYIPGKGQDRHHIKPRSRGGTDADGVVVLPKYLHDCWHKLFDGMMVYEVHAFIDVVMQPDTVWTFRKLVELRRQIMFGR